MTFRDFHRCARLIDGRRVAVLDVDGAVQSSPILFNDFERRSSTGIVVKVAVHVRLTHPGLLHIFFFRGSPVEVRFSANFTILVDLVLHPQRIHSLEVRDDLF